jgi:hypothetical protein
MSAYVTFETLAPPRENAGRAPVPAIPIIRGCLT